MYVCVFMSQSMGGKDNTKNDSFCFVLFPPLGHLSLPPSISFQTRDWNEELQTTRELPRKNLPDRLLRERAIFKVTFVKEGVRNFTDNGGRRTATRKTRSLFTKTSASFQFSAQPLRNQGEERSDGASRDFGLVIHSPGATG